MRDCAAETRALAENMKTRGARTGLLELAASYDRKADEVEAAISQITDPFPGPSPQPALAWRFFYSLMPRTGAGRFLLNLRQQLSKTLMALPSASPASNYVALREIIPRAPTACAAYRECGQSTPPHRLSIRNRPCIEQLRV
jgi:hypothetical protein